MSDAPTLATIPLTTALSMEVTARTDDAVTVRARVHDGFDVHGIPHGGYLAAIAARSVLLAAGQPDLFTVTVHFMRKATMGPMDLEVVRVGGSRRFATWRATATQDGQAVLTALCSVGDRTDLDGPGWTDAPAWDPAATPLSPPAGHPDLPFAAPAVASQFGLRLALDDTGFVLGQRSDTARLRAVLDTDEPDQLAAIVACDVTPPAAWNPLGREGWVPTIELTVHVRARPAPGPLAVDVTTHHVTDGFLDEDAVVHDATGRLVAQSRQLARWTA
ncbi:thioesterase family protein [Salsipaludibacter albus]|uniref:thioesterase family protein n=1 Tax=Salsipaludibacter albus TaxID=2849650 RepID=UPI001EE3D2B0|nr:thioesterase family protein [Salsipaludibacter albus]MBY5164171.1 thioesterase family protein [Salsipaludibacter albus]